MVSKKNTNLRCLKLTMTRILWRVSGRRWSDGDINFTQSIDNVHTNTFYNICNNYNDMPHARPHLWLLGYDDSGSLYHYSRSKTLIRLVFSI